MGHALQLPPPGFDDLTVEEKIEYIQALWNRIAAHPEIARVPESHREALAARIAAYRAGEGESRPWPEVREEIRVELRKLRR